jgi:hypothetical protein
MFASYTAGELVEVILQEAILREKALDLWVAIVSDEGVLVFITCHCYTSWVRIL